MSWKEKLSATGLIDLLFWAWETYNLHVIGIEDNQFTQALKHTWDEQSRVRGIYPYIKQLHKWYLEAVKELNPESFNPDANKPYSELTEEQKFIDGYIARQLKELMLEVIGEDAEMKGVTIAEDERQIERAYSQIKGYNLAKSEQRKRLEELFDE